MTTRRMEQAGPEYRDCEVYPFDEIVAARRAARRRTGALIAGWAVWICVAMMAAATAWVLWRMGTALWAWWVLTH